MLLSIKIVLTNFIESLPYIINIINIINTISILNQSTLNHYYVLSILSQSINILNHYQTLSKIHKILYHLLYYIINWYVLYLDTFYRYLLLILKTNSKFFIIIFKSVYTHINATDNELKFIIARKISKFYCTYITFIKKLSHFYMLPNNCYMHSIYVYNWIFLQPKISFLMNIY